MAPPTDGPYGSNYCLFEWTENGWQPIDNQCEYGFHCVPPDDPGQYLGQLMPTPCERD
jgi:hypothetical protein